MPPMLFKERLEQLRSIVASWTDDELSAARAGVEEELRAIDVEQGRRWQPNQPSPRK